MNGERIDFADVLLDGERPGDVYTVLTVYDPAQGEFVPQTALLLEAQGAAVMGNKLFLWTGAEAALYAFTLGEEGLTLTAEKALPGAVAEAAAGDSGLTLLLQTGDGAALLTMDGELNETGSVAAQTDNIRCGQVFEDGAAFLTDSELHWLSPAGDRALEVTGDGLRRLSEDKLLVFSADGKMQLVSLAEDALKALGAADVRNDMALLLEDPSRMDYDPATRRLVFPAGQRVSYSAPSIRASTRPSWWPWSWAAPFCSSPLSSPWPSSAPTMTTRRTRRRTLGPGTRPGPRPPGASSPIAG